MIHRYHGQAFSTAGRTADSKKINKAAFYKLRIMNYELRTMKMQFIKTLQLFITQANNIDVPLTSF